VDLEAWFTGGVESRNEQGVSNLPCAGGIPGPSAVHSEKKLELERGFHDLWERPEDDDDSNEADSIFSGKIFVVKAPVTNFKIHFVFQPGQSPINICPSGEEQEVPCEEAAAVATTPTTTATTPTGSGSPFSLAAVDQASGFPVKRITAFRPTKQLDLGVDPRGIPGPFVDFDSFVEENGKATERIIVRSFADLQNLVFRALQIKPSQQRFFCKTATEQNQNVGVLTAWNFAKTLKKAAAVAEGATGVATSGAAPTSSQTTEVVLYVLGNNSPGDCSTVFEDRPCMDRPRTAPSGRGFFEEALMRDIGAQHQKGSFSANEWLNAVIIAKLLSGVVQVL